MTLPNTPAQDKLTQTERDERAAEKHVKGMARPGGAVFINRKQLDVNLFLAGANYGREDSLNQIFAQAKTIEQQIYLFKMEREAYLATRDAAIKEADALKASLETAVAALEFYSTPSFLSRDNGKTWQELVQLIPHIYSEKFNADIQREVEFGTVAQEALEKIRKDGGV